MLDPNNFDKALRSAEQLDKIMSRMESRNALRGISSQLEGLKTQSAQVQRIIDRNQMLLNITDKLAMRQAGINKRTLDRVTFYDRELAAVRRNTAELNKSVQVELKRMEQQNAAADRQRAAFDTTKTAIESEISRRGDLMADLSEEYNLRMSMSGFDVKAADVANDLATNNGRLLQLQTRLATIESNKLKVQNASSAGLDAINGKLADQTKIAAELAKQKEADKLVFAEQAKGEAKDFIKNKFAGGIAGEAAQLGKSIKNLGLALGALALFALLLKSVLGAYRDGLKATIAQGLDASQRVGEVVKGQKIVAQALERGALIGLEEAIQAKGALTAVFGTLDIPDELIVKSAELTRQLGLSTEEAANLFDFFGRIRGESAAAAATSAVVLKATALSNRANPAQVMRDVAMNAANFAKSGRAGADELARAAILTRRMGIDLGTIAGIADNIVSNFEGTLEAQASIGTFAPGFDQTGLMVAAQFGTDEDIARELKASVDSLGTDFDSLPRSFKLSIASGLGVSVDQLAKIAKNTGDAMDVVSPDAQAMIKAEENKINELQQAIVNPLGSVEKGIFAILSFMTFRFSKDSASEKAKSLDNTALAKNAAGGESLVDKIFGTGDSRAAIKEMERRSLQKQIDDLSQIQPKTKEQQDRIAKMMSGAKDQLATFDAESRAVGGTVGVDKAPAKSLSLTSMFNKLSSNEVPTILHKGEAVLNKSQMNMMSQLTGSQSGIAKSMSSFVGNFADTFAGKDGVMGKITGFFGGNKSGGIMSSLTKSLGGSGGSGGIMGSITKSLGGSGGIMGKMSGLFGGGTKGIASNLVGKIPGIGGIAKGFMGGGVKGIGGSLAKGGIAKLGGAKIGAMLGSVIPGAGTLVGGVLGAGVSKLANTKIGKAVSGFIGKSPIGKVAGSALGSIGRGLGGLFGRKKKPQPTQMAGLSGPFDRNQAPQPSAVQRDVSQRAGTSGMMSFGGSLGTSNFQSGIKLGGQQPVTRQAPAAPQMAMGNTQALENKLDTLINLLKSGAIGVNIDGKKVSNSLVDANRYG